MIYNLHIALEYDKELNYLRQIYGFNKIKSVTVLNDGDETVRDLKLKISFLPDVAQDWFRYIGEIPAHGKLVIDDPKVLIDPEALLPYNEALGGHIICEVNTADDKSDPVCKESFPVTIHPYDQWRSVSQPQLIACFVTPNDRRVLDIVARAGQKANMAFSGYSGSSPAEVKEKVLKIMRLIYEVIQEEKITYCYPPANWELGQRVRFPGFILANKLGCCIDMACLYAACLEACDLKPVICCIRGHAFAGCWLKDAGFEDIVTTNRELVEVRTLNKSGEIAFVECTLMDNYAFGTNFKYAVDCTDKHFTTFEYVVDIHRARIAGYKPMPLKEIHDDWLPDGDNQSNQDKDNQGGEGNGFYDEDDDLDLIFEDGDEAVSKMEHWERKILDITARNALLNIPFSRALPVIAGMGRLKGSGGVEAIVEALNAGKSLHVLAAPGEIEKVPDSRDLDAQNLILKSLADLCSADLSSGRMRLLLTEKETEKRLKQTCKQAKAFIQESGTNALYLAAGFLKWRQNSEKKSHYAPLVLIPVSLEQSGSNSSFVLKLREDEWQVNTTLLEMLRQKFGMDIKGLDQVPMHDNKLAYNAMLRHVADMVKVRKGWDVADRACICMFSFGQFMMWQDLHNHSDYIASQPIISALVNGHLPRIPKSPFVVADQLDLKVAPDDLMLTMNADGSQMIAIEAAAKGESIVVYGPPGGGKSQTITNMIASTLSQGKTVLFLAKKMPALEVVQKRLESIGLGPFCLELHANKASKAHVLKQFEETLSMKKAEHPGLYHETAHALMMKRMEIRKLIELMHRQGDCGLSLYEVMNLAKEYEAAPDVVNFDPLTAGMVTKEEMTIWKRELDHLKDLAGSMSAVSNHPLKGIAKESMGFADKQKLSMALSVIQKKMPEFEDYLDDMLGVMEIERDLDIDQRDYVTLVSLAANQIRYPRPLSRLITERGYSFEEIKIAWLQAADLQDVFSRLDEKFDRDILTENIAHLKKGFLAGGMTAKRVIKRLKDYALYPEQINADNAEAILNLLEHTAEGADRYKDDELTELLFRNSHRIRFDEWQHANDELQKLIDIACELDIDDESYNAAVEYFHQQALSAPEDIEEHCALAQRVTNLYEEIKAAISEVLSLSGYEHNGRISDLVFDRKWQIKINEWKNHFHEIDPWCCYVKDSERARSCGLSDVVDAIEEGLDEDMVIPAFYKSWSNAYIRRFIASSPELTHFSGMSCQQMTAEYERFLSEFERMCRMETLARLTDALPDLSAGEGTKDYAILRKAIKGGGSQMTIRQLFSRMPEAVRTLAPCMMMSPASVAQYIDVDFPKFDLVIIDEASQMPTCEAVGALARGKAAVIVGDPEQLPPTNFFKSRRESADIELEDLESILDDALALNIPQCHLNWHYRSAHESLITFSNKQYYDNRLFTFPSPDNQVSAVKFVRVEGIYDRSETRTNEIEADEVIKAMAEQVVNHPEKSLGVITFNVQQMHLIEEKWEKRLAGDEALAEVVRSMPDEIFIKNLENIQGDERDVIFFSLGFGPDDEGNMTMNFGPVNQNGGHRRLNVAVTRSRQQMVIFSSFDPEMIRTTTQSARGMRDLKTFLMYAAYGTVALNQDDAAEEGVNKFDMSRQLADALKAKGYECDIHVGASSFKVHVAVKNPKSPDTYMLGILFDDAPEALKETVKDRMILQKQILMRMGWHLTSLWVLDWWQDSEAQLGRILEVLHKLEEEQENNDETEQQK